MLLEQSWVRYFPDLRLGGVEHKEFFLSCKSVVQSPGKETRFPRCVWGFSGCFFVWFVLLFLLPGVIFLFSLFPWSLEKVWNVFLSKLLHVRA